MRERQLCMVESISHSDNAMSRCLNAQEYDLCALLAAVYSAATMIQSLHHNQDVTALTDQGTAAVLQKHIIIDMIVCMVLQAISGIYLDFRQRVSVKSKLLDNYLFSA